MGTNKTNVEIYLELWEKFEFLLKKKKITLGEFSKNWENFDEDDNLRLSDIEYNDTKFLDKLKKQKKKRDSLRKVDTKDIKIIQKKSMKTVQKKSMKTVQKKSIYQLKEYIKFLDKGFITQELHHTETYESLFS